MVVLFFYCYGDHRDLHSFPTRRSSDLWAMRLSIEVSRTSTRRDSRMGSSRGNSSAISVRVDRKSTRLNSSHLGISYAVFCLKKKTSNESHDKRIRCSIILIISPHSHNR